MFKIIKNTYPKNGIGMHEVGTLCEWVTERGYLTLKKCDVNGKILDRNCIKENGITIDISVIFTYGQVYAQNGNLLSGKKEPKRVGVVAKYVKKGWYLELAFCQKQ